MGDCMSKGVGETSFKSELSPNNLYFHEKIDIEYVNDPESLMKSELPITIDRIKSQLKVLNHLSKNLTGKIQKNPEGKLLVEVQRAKNVKYTGFCFSSPKPLVEIEFSPIEVINQTTAVSPNNPVWNKLFIISKSLMLIRFIVLRLFQVNKFDQFDCLGTVKVDVIELANSEIVEKWVHFGTAADETSPGLYVKMQMIMDPQEFFQRRLIELKNKSALLKDTFVKCKILNSKAECEDGN